MRDIIDTLKLIEAVETKTPNYHFLMLEDGDIYVLEDDQSIQKVVDVIRNLGKTGEGQQISQEIFGKSTDEVTDQEIYNKLIVPGYDALKPYTDIAKRSLSQIPKGMTASDVAGYLDNPFTSGFAKDAIKKMAPKGRVGVNAPGIGSGSIDVDVSDQDIDSVLNAYKNLGKQFPKAKEMIDKRDVEGALRQIYNRMGANV